MVKIIYNNHEIKPINGYPSVDNNNDNNSDSNEDTL